MHGPYDEMHAECHPEYKSKKRTEEKNIKNSLEKEFNYCPNCGYKLKGK